MFFCKRTNLPSQRPSKPICGIELRRGGALEHPTLISQPKTKCYLNFKCSGRYTLTYVLANRIDAQELTFRVVTEKPNNAEEIRERVDVQLRDFNSNWRDSQEKGFIPPLQVEFITVDQLQLKSSVKVSDIVEERFINE